MQTTIHVKADQEVDVHAPASTYYTTGNNSGASISRMKTLTVRGTEPNFVWERSINLAN